MLSGTRDMTPSKPTLHLQGFAELDVGAGDDLLEFGFAPVEWQLPQFATIQVQHESDHDDLF